MGVFRNFTTFVAAPIAALSLAAATPALATPAADVIFIVDESGSMGGEHNWLTTMVDDLQAGLAAAGIGTGTDVNRYGLVGFGSGHSSGQAAHQHDVGGSGSQFGTDAQFATAAGGLVASGSFEDGYDAIAYALNNYSIRTASDVALNIILVTDEDRDVTSGSTNTYASILGQLNDAGAILNAVVDANTVDAADNAAIGLTNTSDSGNAFVADGSGGFTTAAGGDITSANGSTEGHYVDLAIATGGAGWNLNILRNGGNDAVSFTAAFVDIKVQEIQEQIPVPEPGMILIFGIGVAGIAMRRRMAA